MELVFLDRATFTYKDHAFISADFELVIDTVVSQKSNFEVNKEEIDAKVGDIAILKYEDFNYVGIINSITQNEDKTCKIQLLDFKELFDIKVPIETYSGNVGELLLKKIKEAFISNSDTKQNLKYLKITNNSLMSGSLTYDDDTLINIQDLIELIAKTYGVILKYKVEFIRGRFSFINIILEEVSKFTKLRYDLKSISSLEIKESEENMVNKVIFYPKKENETHKDIVCFYLLRDGSITQDQSSSLRFNYVNVESEYYVDNDYESLLTKASEKMVASSNDHQTTFKLSLDNKVFKPLSNIYVGYYIEFYAPKRVYITLLTQIKYKGTFNECTLTLGEQRNSLTDKIKLLSKGEKSGGVSVASTIVDLDGGTY